MTKCISCGETKPDSEFYDHPMMTSGHLNKCKTCCKAQSRAYRRAWRVAHPDRFAEKRRRDSAWRKARLRDGRLNREELQARAKVVNYYRAKAWHEANRERSLELGRRHAMAHAARKLGAAGSATADQIASRWAYFGNRCWMCGAQATETDHVIPLARGGSDWPSNQRPACKPCNRAKGARLIAA